MAAKRTTSTVTGTATKTSTATTTRSAVTKTRTRVMPTEDQIRDRAFQIFLARNGAPGDARSDWLQAERELINELNR